LEFPAHEDEASGLDEIAVALERLRKDDDLDAALRVLEREHGHPVALACLERAYRRDDTTDARVRLDRFAALGTPGVAARSGWLRLGEIGDRLCAEIAQRRGVPIDRVAAPVQAERFLLECELLGLGPCARVRQARRDLTGLAN